MRGDILGGPLMQEKTNVPNEKKPGEGGPLPGEIGKQGGQGDVGKKGGDLGKGGDMGKGKTGEVGKGQ